MKNLKLKIANLFLLLCFLLPVCHAQNQRKIDSLKNVLTTLPAINNTEADTSRLAVCMDIGYMYESINPDSAIYWYNQVIDTLYDPENIKSFPRRSYYNALACNDIGVLYYEKFDFKIAMEFLKHSLEMYEILDNKKGVSRCIYNMGLIYEDTGRYDEAVLQFSSSLEIAKQMNYSIRMADCYNGLGIVYCYQGNYEPAIEYFIMSSELYEKTGDLKRASSCYNNIGVVYIELGRNDLAMEYHIKSMNIREEIGDKHGLAESYGNIGMVHQEQGNYPKAMEYHLKALDIDKEFDDVRGISAEYNNMGNVYQMMGEYEKAVGYYVLALRMNEKLEDQQCLSQCYGNLACAYDYMLNYDSAMYYYQKALETDKQIDDKNGLAMVYGNISLMHIGFADMEQMDSDRYKKLLNTALEYQQNGYSIATKIGSLETLCNAYEHLSHIYFGLKNFEEAEKYKLKWIELLNSNILMNFSFISEKEKELYFKTVEENYMDFCSFALVRKESNPAIVNNVYNNTIRNKGLLLKSSTAMRSAILNSNNPDLIKKYEDWISLKRNISDLYSTDIDQRDVEISVVENHADSIEAELVKLSNVFSDFEKTQKLDWTDIKENLKDGEAAIEFVHFKWKGPYLLQFTDSLLYCALLITHNCIFPEMIPLFTEKDLLAVISPSCINNTDYVSRIYGKKNENNVKLYNLIWKPVEKYLGGINTVYLSSAGLLHKVNFSAICTGNNIYLSDLYNIVTLSSTGQMVISKDFIFDNNINVSLWGGINYNSDSTKNIIWTYLDGTMEEARAIEKICNQQGIKTVFYSGIGATEEAMKKTAPGSNILHIATHGFFYPDPQEVSEDTVRSAENELLAFRGGSAGFGNSVFVSSDNPLMRSGLALARANDVWSKSEKSSNAEDGVLTAQEVAHIDMRNTQIVVLSACETGLGDIRGSEGVYGLQRAFKMAGVKYIIMSLWQVPDKETVEFMEMFYKKLLKSKDVRSAFNETQKEMRKKYDPYFWAAFVLIE